MSTAELDALLAGRVPRTDEELRLTTVIDALRAAPPRAPQELRARVTALRAQPRRFTLPAPRRLLFVLVPSVVAIAVVAAVVHGLTGSTRSHALQRAGALEPVQHGAVRAAPSATVPLAGGVGAAGSTPAFAPAAGAKVAAPAPSPTRLTRYDASITVRVGGGGLGRSTNEATAVARGLGGYAASVEYRTPQGRPGEAFLELRVPTGRVQTALARLAALGTLLSQRVSVQDLESKLERQSAQIGELRRAVTLLGQALRSSTLTPLQRIQLQLRLGETKRALAQRTHARNSTIAEGTLARISLVLTAQRAAAAVPHHRGRLGRLVHGAISFLGLEATVALYALIVATPLLVLAALAWAAAVARRRRDERRLLSAPS